MADDLHAWVMRHLLDKVAQDGPSTPEKLAFATHLLGKYRAELVKPQVIRQLGLTVQSGPFAGMHFLDRVAEGCFLPKLLGTYEAELHGTIERLLAADYDVVLNIGCAEGYYAVGWARRCPDTLVCAHDDQPGALQLCEQLQRANAFPGRIQLGGRFEPSDFARYGGKRVLVFCDVEGAELELLDPDAAPALRGFDLLVEMHDVFHGDLSAQLTGRFRATHDIEIIGPNGRDPSRFPALARFSQLDQWLALWEWRSGPTPWALMLAKDGRPVKAPQTSP